MQRVAAQVEEAVLEANVFRIFELAKDGQRQFLGRGKHFDVAGENFDLAGRHVGVHGVVGAGLHLAVNPDNPFTTHGFRQLERRRIRAGDDLRQAIMIADIDEENAAMVADAVNPAGKTNGRTNVRFTQGGAGMAAVTVHDMCL